MVLPLLVFSLLSLYAVEAFSAPANPEPFTIQQPDGQTITARRQGDEWGNWVETLSGYTIAPDQNKVWHYVGEYAEPMLAQGLNQGDTPLEQPVLTNVPATDPPPAGLLKHAHPVSRKPSVNLNMLPANENSIFALYDACTIASAHKAYKVLFILADFNNQRGYYLQPDWMPLITNNINRNSIDSYYRQASYGKVSMTPAEEDDSALGNGAAANNGVIGWVNISQKLKDLETSLDMPDKSGNHPFPAGSDKGDNKYNRLIAKAAMQAAEPYIDYSKYDNNPVDGFVTSDELAIVVVVAGYESGDAAALPNVSAHAWNIFDGEPLDEGYPEFTGKSDPSKTVKLGAPKAGVGPLNGSSGYSMIGEKYLKPATPPDIIPYYFQSPTGTIDHELGHQIFGLPDLYDINTTKAPNGEINRGAGSWSVMATGNYGAKTGEIPGETPVLLDAWSKLQLCWIKTIPKRDRVELKAAGSDEGTSQNSVYKISIKDSEKEYFLIENRQNLGYDQGLQYYISDFSGGLAIWHIDDSISCDLPGKDSNNCNSLCRGKPCDGKLHPRVYLEAGNRAWITNLDGYGADARQTDLFYNGGGKTKLNDSTTPTNSRGWNGVSLNKDNKLTSRSIQDIKKSTSTTKPYDMVFRAP